MGSRIVVPESPSLYQIETRIREGLALPLPGAAAHLRLAPRPRRGWHPSQIRPGARAAAGLVLLYPRDERPHVLLTVRSGALPQHGGQVSLPGGKVEPEETIRDAALREAAEEVGLEPAGVRVLGVLSTLYIPVSDFALHPVVGVADACPAFRRHSPEVARIVDVPLALLRGPDGAPRRGAVWRRGERVLVPYFEVLGERVWGATAMILAELLALLGAAPADPWGAGAEAGARETPAGAPLAPAGGPGGRMRQESAP